MSRPVIVQPGAGKLLDLGNFETVVLANASDTSNAFTLLQTQNEPTDFGPPMHIHHDAAEAFFVLEGTYLMIVEDRHEVCPPGTFVYVPRGTAHTFKVVSENPGKKLNLFAPAAMQGFIEDLAAAEAAGVVLPDDLEAISTRHHMQVVGPVPDSYLWTRSQNVRRSLIGQRVRSSDCRRRTRHYVTREIKPAGATLAAAMTRSARSGRTCGSVATAIAAASWVAASARCV